MTGTLYIVATPIGNLDDITLRAIRTLRTVDYILAEDTRTTSRLLARYRIETPFYKSYYQGVEKSRVESVLRLLKAGKDLALVSDAGTPLVSDPGYPLVRAAVERGIRVVPIPGACAALAGLVASGLPPDRFCFEGILPRKESERRKRIEGLINETRTMIIYESPHRLISTLKILSELIPEREVVLARELTKRHEEFIRGTPAELLHAVEARPVKGEIVLVIAGAQEEARAEGADAERLVSVLREEGVSSKAAVRILTEFTGIPRNEAYRLVHSG
ncbi:16S rRNA (cytidine(1402)-2'-O)-methyltransferase [Candidatus Bipolaricaulota bacterium]|nr:16S rRNA (cytidine(1402)-2'-O)-methyltransferase [Candidatus Bipolaricaulota bacterium]